MQNNFYVYAHQRKDNGRCFYIGKGKGKRAFNTKGRNQHWNNVVNKADGFNTVILVNNIPEELAFKLEQSFIDQIGLENLCNQREGGDGGWTCSEEQKAIISKANKGRKHSQETINKRSKALKGKPAWNKGKPAWNKGKKTGPLSQEHRAKISKAGKGKRYDLVTCPHCGKVGGKNVMPQHHFDNCKELK